MVSQPLFQICLIGAVSVLMSGTAMPEDALGKHTESELFDAVEPILATRCLGCHNDFDLRGGLDLSSLKAANRGGDSGSPWKHQQPLESLFWNRVASGEMPPGEELPEEEIEHLRRWLLGGAKWGTDTIDGLRYSSDDRAGYDWWAFQRLQLAETDFGDHHPIDFFVRRKLSDSGIQPSRRAAPRTLLRRLSFDIIGLPPSQHDLERFDRELSPAEYASLVDELLASPHYGERWARHWLDLVRFGESQGFERDRFRPHAWRYRDWVIEAFNQDMPYDEFARWQLAGDALEPENAKAIVATGFLVAGTFDEVGNNQQSAAMRAVVRQDELEDIVSAVGQTFLGLTINCARCHDHKFDPISQEEYYQLAACLSGVRHGDRNLPDLPDTTWPNSQAIEKLEANVATLESAARATLVEKLPDADSDSVAVPPLISWDFTDGTSTGSYQLEMRPKGRARVADGQLYLPGQGASFAASDPLPVALDAWTLDVDVSVDNLGQQDGAAVSIHQIGAERFDALTYRKSDRSWRIERESDSGGIDFEGPEETVQGGFVRLTITFSEDGWVRAYRNGFPYGKPVRSTVRAIARDRSQILAGLLHTPFSADQVLKGKLRQLSVFGTALSAEQVAQLAGVNRDSQLPVQALVSQMARPQRQLHEQLTSELQQLRELLARSKAAKAYAVVSEPAEPTHVLIRGNAGQLGRQVPPGGVSALNGPPEFKLTTEADDHRRRTALADWITAKSNPLFARVMMNRLWQHHFGSGLVTNPSDFGFNGGEPSHPELLDWLAIQFVESGFSLKAMHRLIVTSQTYQQASTFRAQAFALDAENRLLWRMTPRRLDAESLRDAILFVSGQLNPSVGGPGYYDFRTHIHNSQFYEMRDMQGTSFNRRSIYRSWVRSARNPFLDAFDCPDPSTKTPSRASTTTPLQSLAMMNNSFVLRMSSVFADEIQRKFETPRQQVAAIMQQVLGRSATEKELKECGLFVQQHGTDALVRIMLNSNEFLYVD